MVFLKLSKVFDAANHCLLLTKIETLSTSPAMWNWVATFLSHQQMRARFICEFSPLVPITRRVTQGSVLGTLVFLILLKHIVSPFNLFVDNLKLIGSSDDIDALAEDVRKKRLWTKTWDAI